ncbi:MAG TPA: FAD-binding protein [Gemmatimonadaceae bacterium]
MRDRDGTELELQTRDMMDREGVPDGTTVTMKARSERDVREIIREAHDGAAPLRIVGSGTWLRGGHPVDAGRRLDVSGLTGIVEYVPGDLTLTARAGTSLAELGDATAAHHQWLPLDPFGDPRGSLGATLATASCGPLGSSIGQPRDLTVGLTFVTGEGQAVQGGGRVVKNVAGFDLVRLGIGAWGTLGVLTEATVRLRARPEADETLALALPAEPDRLADFLTSLRQAAIDPLCAELLNGALATRLSLGDGEVLLVRLAGNPVAVHHQRDVLARLGDLNEAPGTTWTKLRESDPRDGLVVRMSRKPSELPRLWAAARTITSVEAHATVTRGIVRLRIPDGLTIADADPLAAFDEDDARIIEQGRAGDGVMPSPAGVGELAERLRLAFDPLRILNRGILGESLHDRG